MFAPPSSGECDRCRTTAEDIDRIDERHMMCWDAESLLAADARAAGQARRFVAAQLQAALEIPPGHPSVEDARLVVSELVTNAVNAGTSAVLLAIHVHRGAVEIDVTDTASGRPELVAAGESDVHGRGLAIVGAIASDWGTELHPGPRKRVWATLPLDHSTTTHHLVCHVR
jgi:anti-sigma regulatory factor (Ser/Thr protein kinase)